MTRRMIKNDNCTSQFYIFRKKLRNRPHSHCFQNRRLFIYNINKYFFTILVKRKITFCSDGSQEKTQLL